MSFLECTINCGVTPLGLQRRLVEVVVGGPGHLVSRWHLEGRVLGIHLECKLR